MAPCKTEASVVSIGCKFKCRANGRDAINLNDQRFGGFKILVW
ncbi:hypothetical protein [uncultured Campylobacter sp.]|nr:hypothetical protein [uncultured Campylobacter sp.]